MAETAHQDGAHGGARGMAAVAAGQPAQRAERSASREQPGDAADHREKAARAQMIKKVWVAVFFAGFVLMLLSVAPSPEWGFFGHTRINRLAIFTLPKEAIGGFKRHIEFLTKHAVDPDMRRYASDAEAPRHYIDLDEFDANLPRKWVDALMIHTDVGAIMGENDTVWLARSGATSLSAMGVVWRGEGLRRLAGRDSVVMDMAAVRQMYYNTVLPQFYESRWELPVDSLRQVLEAEGFRLQDVKKLYVVDGMSQHGILPYHLQTMQRRLTEAFRKQDLKAILRNAADIGHYIGDAHVPLHTTSNYNGQKTGQTGIHAFWESRLPELYADAEYDFLVGQAEYIEDKEAYFWKIVHDSHSLVDSVLSIEKQLSSSFPTDRQYTFEQRGQSLVQTPSREFSAAYHTRLDGMVEARMRAAILAVGSVWYTAWVDAGKPQWPESELKLSDDEVKEAKDVEQKFQIGKIFGRAHDN